MQAFFDLQLGIRINQVHSKVPESPKSNHEDYDSYIHTLTPEIIMLMHTAIIKICQSLKYE